MKQRRFLFLLLGMTILAPSAGAKTLFVDRNAPGPAHDGASWTAAFLTVMAGLSAATGGDEVWVAKGTYAEVVQLPAGVALYGGFAGTETTLEQRDGKANPTILDGSANPGKELVTCRYPDILVDGFTFRNGAEGVLVEDGTATITQCTIRECGGGVHVRGGTATIRASSISDHRNYGVFVEEGATATLTDNVITGVSSRNGTAVATFGTTTLIRNAITSSDDGVEVYRGNATLSDNVVSGNTWYGVFIESGTVALTNNTIGGNGFFGVDLESGTAIIKNNTISDNGTAGVLTEEGTTATLINNTVSGNRYTGVSFAGSATLVNNTITGNAYIGVDVSGRTWMANNVVAYNGDYGWGGCGVSRAPGAQILQFTHNDVFNAANYDGYTPPSGQGNLSVDPRLSSPFRKVHIQPDSPCIDAGLDPVVTAGSTDIDGQDRIRGDHVDIGSDESDGTAWEVPAVVLRVSPDGCDAADGLTWATAKRTVLSAVMSAHGADEVWVARGTYCHFNLPLDVGLYGGFAGTETQREQRDWRANPTVLDGSLYTSPLTFEDLCPLIICETEQSVVDGFTIRRGPGYFNVRGSPSVIANNVIIGGDWAGVMIDWGEATLTGNAIYGCYDGVSLNTETTAILTNNTIAFNSGNGVYVYDSAILSNNVIVFNGECGVYVDEELTGTIAAFSHNDVYGNGAGNTSGFTPPSGMGNISFDPLFVYGKGGNFHLSTGSACIDAGDDTAASGDRDLTGRPRILSSHVDIGAYEYDPTAPPYTMGDVMRCLSIAAGLEVCWPDDLDRLNVEASNAILDLADTLRLTRKVMGMEDNP